MARKVYSSEEIGKRMETLPEAAADFLYSSEMGGIVRDIANGHSLHIDQTGLLEAETGQLILGLTEPQEFAPYIAESLKISAEQSASIAKDVNEKIMSKIRAGMGQPSSAPAHTASPVSTSASTPAQKRETSAPSVLMPSSSTPVVPPVSTPTPTSSPALAPTPAPKPIATPNLGAADAILSEKKVTPPSAPIVPPAPITAPIGSATKAGSPVPQPYKADPYREPVE